MTTRQIDDDPQTGEPTNGGMEQPPATITLDLETSPEVWRETFEGYYNGVAFLPHQIQAQTSAEAAMSEYSDLLVRLSEHQGDIACLYRIGRRGSDGGDPLFQTQVEDVIFFMAERSQILVTPTTRITYANRQSRFTGGIEMTQPLLAYAQRLIQFGSGDYANYRELDPGMLASRRGSHELEPVGGRIILSFIDSYDWPARRPLPLQGLEFATRDTKFASRSVSPERHDPHMRLFVGTEQVAEQVKRGRSYFEPKSEDSPLGRIMHQVKEKYKNPA